MKKTILIIGIIFLLVGIAINPSTAVFNSNDDITPPTTSYSLDPSTPNGENGWYKSVAIIIYAYDSESGVNSIQVSLNGGSWLTQPGDIAIFIFDSDGDNFLVRYTAVDNAGNQAPIKNFTIDIDGTNPVVIFEYECEKIDWGGWLFYFNATANDKTSKMNRVEFYLNDVLQDTVIGPGPIYSWKSMPGWGLNPIIRAVAYDFAGNSAYKEIKNPHIREKSIKYTNHPLLKFLDHFPILHRLLDIWRDALV